MKQSLNFSWLYIKGFKEAYLTQLDKSMSSVKVEPAETSVAATFSTILSYGMFISRCSFRGLRR